MDQDEMAARITALEERLVTAERRVGMLEVRLHAPWRWRIGRWLLPRLAGTLPTFALLDTLRSRPAVIVHDVEVHGTLDLQLSGPCTVTIIED